MKNKIHLPALAPVLLGLVLSAAGRQAAADTYTIHIHASYNLRTLDWTTPDRLIKGVIRNKMILENVKHGLGHADFDLDCSATADSPAFRFVGGQTGLEGPEVMHAILGGGYGMGFLMHGFTGHFYTEKEVTDGVLARTSQGGQAFMTFDISSQTCQRMRRYLGEYVRRGHDLTWGLGHYPLRAGGPRGKGKSYLPTAQGASCLNLASSMLEVSGLLEDDYQQGWLRTVNVPRNLVGGYWSDNKINTVEVLLGGDARTVWASPEDTTGYTLEFYDPLKMYDWIKFTRGNAMNGASSGIEAERFCALDGKLVRMKESEFQAARARLGRTNRFELDQSCQNYGIRVDRTNVVPPTSDPFAEAPNAKAPPTLSDIEDSFIKLTRFGKLDVITPKRDFLSVHRVRTPAWDNECIQTLRDVVDGLGRFTKNSPLLSGEDSRRQCRNLKGDVKKVFERVVEGRGGRCRTGAFSQVEAALDCTREGNNKTRLSVRN